MENTKSMALALRRHHAVRVKQNRRFYFGRDLAHEPLHWSKLITTTTPCSCVMCGNPRKYFGDRTIQERRLMQVC